MSKKHKEAVQRQFTKTAEAFSKVAVRDTPELVAEKVEFARPQVTDFALDVACGPGTFVLALAPRVHFAHGLDLTEEMLRQARTFQQERQIANACFEAEDAGAAMVHIHVRNLETGKGAHLFAPEEVPGIIAANLEGVKVFMERARGPGLAVRVTDAVTGEPLVAQVWLPRIENNLVDRRVTEGAFGHYWRMLQPGHYELIISCPGYETTVLHDVTVVAGDWTPLTVQLDREK